jgi:hypothetical protein
MLRPISQVTLTDTERIAAVLKGWMALDTETGAFLSQTRGRGKRGLPTYILILPNKTLIQRGGLFAEYDWDYPKDRKFIREWTDEAAIETANKRLRKMLKQRATELIQATIVAALQEDSSI